MQGGILCRDCDRRSVFEFRAFRWDGRCSFFCEDDANVVAIAKAGEAISCALVVKKHRKPIGEQNLSVWSF